MPSERELKVDVPFHFALPDLSPSGIRLQARPATRLSATYYDTADLRLLRRGITFRHRRGEGSGEKQENGWTLKLPERPGGSGPRLDRTELEWPGPPTTIPDEARALLRGVSHGRSLAPVADMVTSRRRWHLVGQEGPLAELDDDDVVVTAEGERLSFRQLEVELTGGDDDLLDAIAQQLADAGAPPGKAEPKVQRALAARLQGEELNRAPLGRNSTLADVVRAAVRAGLDRLLAHDPGVRLHQDPEFVHQARVATRRLRSDLRTLRAAVEPEWVGPTRDELRWLGGLLGDVRDADVLGERLEGRRPLLANAEHPVLDVLIGRLRAQRGEAYDRLDEAMAGERYWAVLDRLEAPPVSPSFEPAASALVPLIEGPWRKLRRQVRAAGAEPSDADLHQIRIRAKQLRYAAEAAAPVLGRPVAQLADAAAGLQTVLGDHHDAVVSEEWLRRATVRVRAKGRLLVAGQLIGFDREDAATGVATWRKSWKAVRKAHAQL